MTAKMSLYLRQPGIRSVTTQLVGEMVIREVNSIRQNTWGQKCLVLEVEAYPPGRQVSIGPNQGQTPPPLEWIQLDVELRINQAPQWMIGRVIIDDAGMLPIGASARSGPVSWLWELLVEDVERVEMARAAQPNAPIFFLVEVHGIAKLVEPSGRFDVVAVWGETPLLSVEVSKWERLLQQLGYSVPPSHLGLAGPACLEHPSWREAMKRLDNARLHHRSGEDYDALRVCLSALEAVVSNPYKADSWKRRLTSLPDQKAEGIAELLSGLATYCNKIGHHRSLADRDDAGDLLVMPLDHWEADVVLGSAQFTLSYALRLREQGILTEEP
jgi:hypothetical protein